MKFESRELLSPLLRFTSLQDGIQHSRLFLRCQKSWFKTTDMIERELSEIRVQLDLHEVRSLWDSCLVFFSAVHFDCLQHRFACYIYQGAWADEFRFLGVRRSPFVALSHLCACVISMGGRLAIKIA